MAINFYGFDGTINETQDAQRAGFGGVRYPVVGAPGDLAVAVVTGPDRTLSVAPGTCFVHGIYISNTASPTIQLDTVTTSGQTRWDAVVLRVDWSANTVSLTKVNGVAAANAAQVLPAGLNKIPGSLFDVPLALVQITYGQTQPSALIPLRAWASKVLTVNTLLALPSPPYGTEVVLTSDGRRYRYDYDASNNLNWVPADSVKVYTAQSVIIATSGWTTVAPMLNRSIKGPHWRQLNLQLRRTGAAIGTNAQGNFPDQAVGTLIPFCRPDRAIWVSGMYMSSTFTFACQLRLDTNGQVVLASGAPNTSVVPQTKASVVSLQIDVAYGVEDF